MNTLNPKVTQKDKYWGYILTAVIIGMITIMANIFSSTGNLSDTDIEKELIDANKELPIQITEYMRLDSIKLTSIKELSYFVTTENLKEEANYDTIRKYVDPMLLDNVKNNPEFKKFRASKVTCKYIFLDKVGEEFYKYSITPDMYK